MTAMPWLSSRRYCSRCLSLVDRHWEYCRSRIDGRFVDAVLPSISSAAVECLIKDRDALLAFYDFPAEHWKHLRTTNVVESSFATVHHRTVRSKGCLSNKTALAMIFKLA